MALVMLVGVFSPLTALAAGEQGANDADGAVKVPTGTIEKSQLSETKPDTTEVNIFKLVTKENYKPGAPWKHTGGKITDISKLGTGVEALQGAKFTFYKINGTDDVENEKILELLKANPEKFETKAQMQDLMTNGAKNLKAGKADTQLTKIAANKITLATGIGLDSNGETNETGTDGKATVNLGDGYYWAIESKIPEKVTGQIAVPFGLTLPLTNSTDVGDVKAGTQYLKSLYIYPKNLKTDKVKIDKNHAQYDEKNKKWVDQNGNAIDKSDLGADYAKYEQDKKTVSAELGKKVPYESKTEIPRNYKFDEFSWQDVMSEGLTYNKDLKVTIDYKTVEGGQVVEKKGEVFIQGETGKSFVTRNEDSGFDIHVKKADVQNTLVEYLKNGPVTFHFSYSATVNKDTVVDKPETNSITYTPGKPNPGGKIKPSDNTITVNKTWGDGNAEPTVTEVTYYVIGPDRKAVASVTLTNKNTEGEKLVAGPDIEFTVGDKWYKGKFSGKGLDNNKEYTIREAVVGYDPTYTTTDAAGSLKINNKSNPDTLKPKEPKVEYHGRKFVKYDQLNGETRLAGAEFVVKNNITGDANNGKYLVAKTSTEANADNVNLTQAKSELDAKVEAYNKLTAEQQKGNDGETAKKAIDAAQQAYNKAFKEAANAYTWGDKDAAVRFVSDSKGGFEVTGLSAGNYQLEEVKAPAGYALSNTPFDFEVKHGTYKSKQGDTELEYTSTETITDDYGKKIANKKVTIPQTGGMGTVLFTIVGISLMAGAVIAMKKNREEA